MLDVFSTENLSIHHQTLIGLKDQFDSDKFLHLMVSISTDVLG